MQKICLFILFTAILSVGCYASDTWIYNSAELEIEVNISAEITLAPTSSNYEIEYVNAYLYFFPKDDPSQTVIKFVTIPEAMKSDNRLTYRFTSFENDKNSFLLNSVVRTKNEIIPVRKKVDFPMKIKDSNLDEYLAATEHIDSDNPSVVALASSLAAGEDDVYSVLFNLGDWIKTNIEYNLTTITADASQKASWVIANKKGVCDEISVLFIAMCRAVGIPARYVGGVAYTNFNDINDFGPHAWAEVYFPDIGWVPFDITYGEYGYVDATHVKLKEFADSDESSTKYEWKGRNVNIDTSKLNIKANVISKKGETSYPLKLTSDILKKEVGFGSYNILEVVAENTEDYYLVTDLIISKNKELSVIGKEIRYIMLKPRETKKVYWLIKNSNDLDERFIYTFSVAVQDSFGGKTETYFKASKENKVYSKEEMMEYLSSFSLADEKRYSRDLEFSCKSKDQNYYVGDNAVIDCKLKNKGNVMLSSLMVCLENNCESFDLGISKEKEITFYKELKNEGKYDLMITAKNNDIIKTASANFLVYDLPAVKVEINSVPNEVEFDEEFVIDFTAQKISKANPVDVKITLKQGYYEKEWIIPVMEMSERYQVHMMGESLSIGNNTFIIRVGYKDDKGRSYSKEQEFHISLKKVNFFQRIFIYFSDFGKWVYSWF